jgi:hypothetical protein
MFKKRSKSPSPTKSRSPENTAEPPVPTPSRSFTFRKSKDVTQRDKKSVSPPPPIDFSPRPESLSFSSYDATHREKPLPEPSGYQVLREETDDVKDLSEEPEGKASKLYRMGTDVLLKANDTYTTDTGYLKTAQTYGTNLMNAINNVDSGLITSAKNAISSVINNNAVIENAIHVADNLADIGKVLPFVAPAFVLLKVR